MSLAYLDLADPENESPGRAYERPSRGTVTRCTSNPVLKKGGWREEIFPDGHLLHAGYWKPRTDQPTRSTPLEAVFRNLCHEWWNDTRLISNVNQKIQHPAYLAIIGLGPDALPLLLAELDERPAQWFWALRSIARTDPAEGLDTFDGARRAWLDWGREHLSAR